MLQYSSITRSWLLMPCCLMLPGISRHGIDYVGSTGLLQGRISSTCTIKMVTDETKYKYYLCQAFLRKHKNICISYHSSTLKSHRMLKFRQELLIFILHTLSITLAADGLAMQGARALTALMMVKIKIGRNISVSAPHKGLTHCGLVK